MRLINYHYNSYLPYKLPLITSLLRPNLFITIQYICITRSITYLPNLIITLHLHHELIIITSLLYHRHMIHYFDLYIT